MDLNSNVNDQCQIEYYPWLEPQQQQQQQQQQQHQVLNGQIQYIIISETELLEPVDLTNHCKCIGEPLIPTLPQLTKEWIEKCSEYKRDGPNFETLKQIRQTSWQSYHSHDDDDFKNLMINMYVDDYNQRLLDMHNNHLHLSHPPEDLETYPTQDDYQFVQSQQNQQFPINHDGIPLSEDIVQHYYFIAETQHVYGYNNQYAMVMPQVDTYFSQPQQESPFYYYNYNNMNVDYPYLQTPIDGDTYMYH